MDIEAVKKIVTKIKVNLFRKSNNYALGMFKSHYRGKGLQFKEHQVYNYGDEVRFIDWKLVAKTGVPFIKTFEEERNLVVNVIIDAQKTMLYGVKGISKFQAACEICCLIFLLSQRTRDKIKVVLLADKIIEVPINWGEKGMIYFLSTLQKNNLMSKDGNINNYYVYEKELSNGDKLQTIKAHLRNKRETVIISDFQDFIDCSELSKLFISRNVHCFQLSSPIDEAVVNPFTKNLRNGNNSQRAAMGAISSPVNSNTALRGKHIKKLKLEERYLDNFVREMI